MNDMLESVLATLRDQIDELNRKPTHVDKCDGCPHHRINGEGGYGNSNLKIGRHVCLASLDDDNDPRLFWGGKDMPPPKKKDILRFCKEKGRFESES